MVKSLESVTVFSKDARKLADFYRVKVGLKQTLEAEVGEKGEELFGFEFKGSASFYIMDHSKITGKNSFPDRIIINFEVDDIDQGVKKLVSAKAKLVQEKYHMQGYGYIATFEDTDGNFFQLVQVKSN